VLDEPTAGLSPADARAVLGLLRPVMAGRTTIVITHDEAVAAQADQIVTLSPLRPLEPLESALTSPW
jgi:ABC-type transport system involved in cytochrome bd biosynthesis fused ATPase/permease subunit